MTSTMSTWRSNQLSYNPMSFDDESYINIVEAKLQYLFCKKQKKDSSAKSETGYA